MNNLKDSKEKNEEKKPYGYDFLIKNKKKPLIYIAGSHLKGTNNSFKIRKEITKALNKNGFYTNDPVFNQLYMLLGETVDLDNFKYNTRVRDEVYKILSFENVVKGDLELILESDGFLMYYETPSVGTSMELLSAKQNKKPTCMWYLGRKGTLKDKNPWLNYHLDFSADGSEGLEKCIEWLNKIFLIKSLVKLIYPFFVKKI